MKKEDLLIALEKNIKELNDYYVKKGQSPNQIEQFQLLTDYHKALVTQYFSKNTTAEMKDELIIASTRSLHLAYSSFSQLPPLINPALKAIMHKNSQTLESAFDVDDDPINVNRLESLKKAEIKDKAPPVKKTLDKTDEEVKRLSDNLLLSITRMKQSFESDHIKKNKSRLDDLVISVKSINTLQEYSDKQKLMAMVRKMEDALLYEKKAYTKKSLFGTKTTSQFIGYLENAKSDLYTRMLATTLKGLYPKLEEVGIYKNSDLKFLDHVTRLTAMNVEEKKTVD